MTALEEDAAEEIRRGVFRTQMTSLCELCRNTASLQGSHVIPSFVYRWLKDTSASGFMRTAAEPNKRVQRGWVRRMLCASCEEHFSVWEKEFAEKFFLPHTNGKRPESESYGAWLFQFALSVSWRALQTKRALGELDAFPARELADIDEAIETWRRFLIGERSETGRFEQHMLLLGMVTGTDDPSTPPNMNRYLTRSVDCVIRSNSKTTYVYVNLCGVLLLGLVEINHRREWKGTRLSPKGGRLSRTYEAPAEVYRLLVRRANETGATLSAMSPRQKAKLDAFLQAHPEAVAQSGSFRAMRSDLEMFGKDAFDKESAS